MGKFSIDTEDLARQMSAARSSILAEGLAAAESEEDTAFIYAQDALFDGRILMAQVALSLQGAGRSDAFIGQVFGVVVRELIANLVAIAADPVEMCRAFELQGDTPVLSTTTFTAPKVRGGSA